MSVLRVLPVLVASSLLLVAPRASAHEEDDDQGSSSSESESSSDSSGRRKKFEVGVALEGFRSSEGIVSGSAVYGGYLGAHFRLGRRVALGVGLEQGYGDDPSGYKRYDIAWNFPPKLYLYLNPKSKTQLYGTAGMDMRVSHFESGSKELPEGRVPWGAFYFGGFLGAGVEHRLDKSMALRIEARWFVRGRSDSKSSADTAPDPEWSIATRGYRGAVLSLGLVFY